MELLKIDYRARLENLASRLTHEAMLVMAQPEATRNSDVGHSYRQESFFHYLTGVSEPESALLVVPMHGEGKKFILFVRAKNSVSEQWEGRRLGVDGAKQQIPVDEVHPIDELWKHFVGYVKGHTKMNYCLGRDENADRELVAGLNAIRRTKPRFFDYKLPIVDSDFLAGEMRHKKGSEEIDRMAQAAKITESAFNLIYSRTRPGMNEKEVYGLILSEFLRAGADMEAYGTIVAGGNNACILHYVSNNMVLRDGDLLLVDAGAQLDYYASDVTRTFPVGKKFTSAQKALYEVVLDANKRAIERVQVGATIPEVHQHAVEVLVSGLLELKLLQGSKSEIIELGTYKKYYMHNTSHWLGMDVHDVGPYNVEIDGCWTPVKFEAGMVLTVEPGLYIPVDDESVPKDFRGIGIRIEDDILVTPAGHRNLTSGIPKEVVQLENRF
jgi:Xaa-Pro aminopeptidase